MASRRQILADSYDIGKLPTIRVVGNSMATLEFSFSRRSDPPGKACDPASDDIFDRSGAIAAEEAQTGWKMSSEDAILRC